MTQSFSGTLTDGNGKSYSVSLVLSENAAPAAEEPKVEDSQEPGTGVAQEMPSEGASS